MKHYCGIFGIYEHQEAARMTYFGLYALQHRGQESAGIVTFDGTTLHEHKAMGLVHEAFTEKQLAQDLKGTIAIGHVRYANGDTSHLRNALPFVVKHRDMDIAISHNGKLTNTAELKAELENQGALFRTDADAEIFAHLIAHYLKEHPVEEAIKKACLRAQGAFTLLILVNNTMFAIRDPHGFNPLMLGKLGNSYVVASETCAFDLLEADTIRQLEPGEMICIKRINTAVQVTSQFLLEKSAMPAPKQCIFEMVYFARPDSLIFNQDVYQCRKRMGQELARESVPDADFVMPFPDSGVYSAVGFAQESGIPYEHAMIRNHYIGRTFIQPSQDMRDFSVRVKINPVLSMIKGKRICIVDDSIVRGTTIRTRVKQLRALGAREIHFRVACPPVMFPCHYGINFSSTGELIAANHSVEEITKFIGLDSLHYLSQEGLLRSVLANSLQKPEYCMACFDGKYPIKPPCKAEQ